jgi:hypothetical protein
MSDMGFSLSFLNGRIVMNEGSHHLDGLQAFEKWASESLTVIKARIINSPEYGRTLVASCDINVTVHLK